MRTTLRKELKERFLQDLTQGERLFFLNEARAAIAAKGYMPGEDLFWYCYYRTLRRRMGGAGLRGGEGYVRVLLARGKKEVEDAIKMYEMRLEEGKCAPSLPSVEKFIEYFSE
jgi:hypothetical protein